MREVTVKLYKFDEMSDAAKVKARDWFREISVDDSTWAEPVELDAKEIAGMFGILEPELHWSGFGSQGDGASVSGRWYAHGVDLSALEKHAPKDEELQSYLRCIHNNCAQHLDMVGTLTSIGHYSHEHSIDFNFECAERAWTETQEGEVIAAFRNFMSWVYAQLEAEYIYRRSDEAIEEDIEANQYEFLESGKRLSV